MIPAWAAQYIGIPFDEHGDNHAGVSCWGLCRLVHREQFGRELPDYEYTSASDATRNGELIKVFSAGVEWREVSRNEMQAGDIVVIKAGFKEPSHVGLVLDQRYFLNTRYNVNVYRDEFRHPRVERRIDGVFRYVG